MNKHDWVSWSAIGLIIVLGLLSCFSYSCHSEQRISNDQLTAPSPAVQLWRVVKKSNWLVSLAIPIIALGAVAMFNGAAKLGMSAIIFGCVNLFMALATARFALWMSIFGLIGSIAAVAMSILVRKKALVEIIKGVQVYRENAIEHDVLDFDLDSKQSESTQKIVKKVKGDLKVKGQI